MSWIIAFGAAAIIAALVWAAIDFRAFCKAEDERQALHDDDWMGI